MAIDGISINIWDDYFDDGFVPEGKIQETFAYIEGSDLTDDESRTLLVQLQQIVESIKSPDSALSCCIEWFDSTAVYPGLVGTEYEFCLKKYWRLLMKHLPHSEREQIVELLGARQIHHAGRPVVIYSES